MQEESAGPSSHHAATVHNAYTDSLHLFKSPIVQVRMSTLRGSGQFHPCCTSRQGCTAVHNMDCVPAKFSCTSVCTEASESLVGSEWQRQVPPVGLLHKVYLEMIWCLLAC